MHKLSIIIPCYNSEKTLKEALDSCYLQGLSDFEVVMVDDGSTDGTRETMEKLAGLHDNIALGYHENNKGGGAARNTAVKLSSGDVIFCLDSDDILPPNTLSKMLAFMNEKICDGVGIHHSIKFNGADINDVDRVDTFSFAGENVPFESLFQKNGVLCSLYSTFMHTKKAFESCGGYPTGHGFDTQGFAWRFLSQGLTAFTCPEASYYHRVNYTMSYYLREAEQGKVNYNWRDIFLEHFALFDADTQKFILDFNCADFTRNIFDELRKRDTILKKNYRDLLGKEQKKDIPFGKRRYISRNSLQGLWLRIRRRVMSKGRIAIEMAEGRSWRIDLLAAFLLLRLKKLIRTGFDTPDEAGEEIDVVVPTTTKDYNLLSRSIESIRKFVSHPVNKVFIVSKNDALIKEFCLKNNYIFVDERDILGYGPERIDYSVRGRDRSGWMFQQLLKLSGDKFTEKKNYLIVDSDTILIRAHLFSRNGVFVLLQSEAYHAPYFRSFERLFGYPVRGRLSLTSHMMIFNTDILKEMKAEIESRHETSWDEALLSTIDNNELSSTSDYETYGNWLHVHYPEKVNLKPFYNKPLARNDLQPLPDLVKKYADSYKSLSFHHYHEQ